MSYSQSFWPVAPALAPLVDAIWVLRCDVSRLEAVAGPLLPQFMWQLSGQLGWIARGNPERHLSPASLLGPSGHALKLTSEGVTTVVGVGVFPEGWQRFVEANADTLVGQVIDLRAFWGDDALAPLAGTPGESDAVLARRVEALLLQRLTLAPQPDPRVAVISQWINGPVQDIAVLADELQVSDRQLVRIARRAHGLPPRVLANKHRALRIAASLAAGTLDVRQAWTEDFADQSHFIEEFRRFMGVTPVAFMQHDGWLVREVMRVRREIASEHPLGLAGDRELLEQTTS